eukprot:3220775-Prorocentrum_lima.AAC.1
MPANKSQRRTYGSTGRRVHGLEALGRTIHGTQHSKGMASPGRVQMQRILLVLLVNTHRPHVGQDLTAPCGG